MFVIRVQKEKDRLVTEASHEMDGKAVESARALLSKFQTMLQTFATDHGDETASDPTFRERFHKMCYDVGVDPLQSRNRFWSKVLRYGDFYHELSVKIIDVSWPLKRKFGALIPMEAVSEAVLRSFGAKRPKIQKEDMTTAVRNLEKLGKGYAVVKVHRQAFLKTSTYEFDDKGSRILDWAGARGWFDKPTAEMTAVEFDWATNGLMAHGFVWADKGERDGSVRYYVIACFPGVFT
jgi:ESCRT-II complex subunit VPS22